MNCINCAVKLYIWPLTFHKVVRQQIWGEVVVLIPTSSARVLGGGMRSTECHSSFLAYLAREVHSVRGLLRIYSYSNKTTKSWVEYLGAGGDEIRRRRPATRRTTDVVPYGWRRRVPGCHGIQSRPLLRRLARHYAVVDRRRLVKRRGWSYMYRMASTQPHAHLLAAHSRYIYGAVTALSPSRLAGGQVSLIGGSVAVYAGRNGKKHRKLGVCWRK